MELSKWWTSRDYELSQRQNYPWKHKILSQSLCDITGDKENLVVHHLFNFAKLVKQASVNTNVPLLNKVSEYYEQNYDLQKLVDEVLRLNEKNPHVVLRQDLHIQFHKQYGLFDNTPEQYQEFKQQILGS